MDSVMELARVLTVSVPAVLLGFILAELLIKRKYPTS
jgi:hypothetical protein